jgi:hypothetical protein
MTVTIGRRELLVAIGGAAAVWPLAARAQRCGVGLLGVGSLDNYGLYLAAFRKGLNDALVGYDMSIMGTGIYGPTP